MFAETPTKSSSVLLGVFWVFSSLELFINHQVTFLRSFNRKETKDQMKTKISFGISSNFYSRSYLLLSPLLSLSLYTVTHYLIILGKLILSALSAIFSILNYYTMKYVQISNIIFEGIMF